MFSRNHQGNAPKVKNHLLEEQNAKREDNYNTMNYIDRQTLIAENIIRQHVSERIRHSIQTKNIAENKIRIAVRRLLSEVETGTEEPSEYTGINVLAGVLEKIIPVLEKDYKMLTTSEEQRDSFRNHIVHAIKNSLRPIESSSEIDSLPEHFEFDASYLLEKLKIDLDATDDMEDAETVEGEFIDIDTQGESDDFVEIDDQNETGRNFAATAFKKVEKNIVDSYDMLADEKDQDLFYDYLITNMLLYFDKFEDELAASLPDVTTPEYEKEKEEAASEDAESASEPPAEGDVATDPADEEPADEEPADEEPAAEAPAGAPLD
jgi:hypothetical protein